MNIGLVFCCHVTEHATSKMISLKRIWHDLKKKKPSKQAWTFYGILWIHSPGYSLLYEDRKNNLCFNETSCVKNHKKALVKCSLPVSEQLPIIELLNASDQQYLVLMGVRLYFGTLPLSVPSVKFHLMFNANYSTKLQKVHVNLRWKWKWRLSMNWNSYHGNGTLEGKSTSADYIYFSQVSILTQQLKPSPAFEWQ